MKVEKVRVKGTPKVTLRDDNLAARGVIREKRSGRSDWKEKAATGQRGEPGIGKRDEEFDCSTGDI
jgi:hypothetical protein